MLTADNSFFQRLLEAGGRGFYLPNLIVRHYVQPEMLTKRYHRRWCFWNAVSLASRQAQTSTSPHLFGIPRWHFRTSLTGLARWARGSVLPGTPPDVGLFRPVGIREVARISLRPTHFSPLVFHVTGVATSRTKVAARQ